MNIPQVKLLKGSHAKTGQTGQGCFMNVIAYLNDEPTITDDSECVCFVMRPLAIWANDWMTDEERPQLLPFILRAMGSRTEDRAEISRRLALVVAFAKEMSECTECAECAKSAAECAEYADKYSAESAAYAKYAKYAEVAVAYAAKSAECAEYASSDSDAESAARRKEIITSLLALFDGAFPPLQDVGEQTYQRVRALEALSV